ncbi:MAG: hypothetical protein N2652_12415 [Kiritimatiellae bacterium]|nr:hypothetical protein [Kiritimatiellia bacterium]
MDSNTQTAPSLPAVEQSPGVDSSAELKTERPDVLDISRVRTLPPTPVRTDRVRRAAKEEEDWALTPEERLARELKRISGVDEEEDEESADNWMARGLAALEKEKKKAREKAEEEQRAEEEAEQIAEIMGRDLFAGLRNDHTTTAIFAGDERGFRATKPTISTSPAPATAVGARELAARTDAPVAERPSAAGRTAPVKPDSERMEVTSALARPASGVDASPATDAPGAGEHGVRRSTPGPEPAPLAPQLFQWSSSAGSGYAGLPSSLAPSVAPSLKAPPPASLMSGTSGRDRSVPSWLSTAPGSSAWSPGRPTGGSVGAPEPAVSAPPPRAGPPLEVMRTPFLNSSPAVLPSRVWPAESLRRP